MPVVKDSRSSWWVARAALLALLIAGCSRRVPPVQLPADAPEWAVAAHARQQKEQAETIQWFTKDLLRAYEEVGTHSPKWDRKMRKAIPLVAQLRAKTYLNVPEELDDVLDAMGEKGCKDPLFRYWRQRYRKGDGGLTFIGGGDYAPVFLVLGRTNYPAHVRFWSGYRAYQQVYGTERAGFIRKHTDRQFLEMLADTTQPDGLMASAADTYLDYLKHDGAAMKDTYAKVAEALQQHWPENPYTYALLGAMEVNLAWLARGSDWATNVKEKDWPVFFAHLERAEQLLEKSWELRPTWLAANTMLTVELGQGKGVDRLDLWFERAMYLEPENLENCADKLYYLRPRWHGSFKEMIAFGKQCLDHPWWRVPLAMVKALEGMAADLPEADVQGFWLRPDVWDLTRRAYERHFEFFPEDEYRRADYFEAAYRSHAWKEMKRQYKKLGDVPYGAFGGPRELARKMLEAEMALEQAKRQSSKRARTR